MNAVARTDALLARTHALLERQAPIEEVVRRLRAEGFGLAESIGALIKEGGMSPSEARMAVVDSSAWADIGDGDTGRWIPIPPTTPDDETVERLRAACTEEPRIVEAWFTGRRVTRADGTSKEITGIALVLGSPFRYTDDDEPTRETIARLHAAAAHAHFREWLYTERLAGYSKNHALRIYTRAAQAR